MSFMHWTGIYNISKYTKFLVVAFAGIMTCACSALLPAPPPQSSYYSLNGMPSVARAVDSAPTNRSAKPTIIINMPQAIAPYNTQHIIYTRTPHKLEYFARSEWVDSPAHMLAPLISTAIERSGSFNAVMLAPTNIVGDFKLDSEIVRLHQAFDHQPSRVYFTLRVYLVNNITRKVIAVREFDEMAISNSDNAYGGVIAANQVVQTIMDKLTMFCNENEIQAKLSSGLVKK